tara:strand:+ start:8941 stop:9843 length:903 start_codon:yes stop_codon:yes gene_type:complete
MRIGSREIGPDHPAYIVAEIGQNHSGFVDLAVKQIRLAKEAGADAVKFQKRTPRLCIPESEWGDLRDTPRGRMAYINYREILELSESDYRYISEACWSVGIDWFASVWDIPSVDFMEGLHPVAYKVPSACLTNDALLNRLKDVEVPVILSTGMSTWEEIERAVSILNPALLCQCTSTYPCPPEEVNLRFMRGPQLYNLCRSWPEPVGYSGHELGTAISIAAVALGANYVERHFTNDKAQWGTDQAMSLEPQEFRAMVDGIREVEAALGDGVKKVYPSEQKAIKHLRGARGPVHAGQDSED